MCCVSENSARPRDAVADCLRNARKIVITTHLRADGDALGSLAALCWAARAAGKDCRMALGEPLPRRYGFIFGQERPEPLDRFADLAAGADALVVVDTCAEAQLQPMLESLRANRAKVAVIDHHATGDDLSDTTWSDTTAAAAGVMTAEMIDLLGWPMDRPTAEALFVAIATDTGWFRYNNTDARVLAQASRLLALGARPNILYTELYHCDRVERIRLLAAALDSLELLADGQLAVLTLAMDDFVRTGATGEETEEFVNEPLRIAGVEASVIFVEDGERIRVSLRSRSRVDVAQVARRFSGGGHARAAGCRIVGDLANVKERVLNACLAAIK
jgi:phosphoesterase RecJ-like protein